MKTILIATDFSPASQNAALYGIELARVLDAKVILFSAYQLPDISISDNCGKDIIKNTEEKLLKEAAFMKKFSPIVFEIISKSGIAEIEINKIAIEKKTDFIILGINWSGKNIKRFFGSTIFKLTKITQIPLFVIPEDANFNTPKKMLLGSDIHTESSIQFVDALIKIIRFFKSKLFVVRVINNKSEERSEKSAMQLKLFKAVGILIPSFQYVVNTNITHALNNFIRENDINWLVILPHKHSWLESFFTKSTTKDMIFQTHIPLLLFPSSL